MNEFNDAILEEAQEKEKNFVCDNVKKAEWCVKQINYAKETKATWKAYFDEQFDKICKECDWTISTMENHLRKFFDTVPHKMAKASESFPLPSAKLVLKRQDPIFTMDDDRLVKYFRDNKLDNYVKTETVTTTTPLWGEFRKTLAKDPDGAFAVAETDEGLKPVTADGEIVDCITVELRPWKFEVK